MTQERSTPGTNAAARREPTRRQLSRREREERRQRIAILLASVATAIALLLILVPFLKSSLWDPRQTLAAVGDHRITRAEYDKYQRLNAVGLTDTSTLPQTVAAYKQNPDGFRDQLKEGIDQAPKSDTPVDPGTLDTIVDNAVLVASAGDAGISLTDADVDAELSSSLIPPTLEPQPTSTPGVASTAGAAATPAASPSARASAPVASPTAQPPSAEDLNGFFGALGDVAGVSREDYERLVIQPSLFRERYREKNVPSETEQVHVRHILVKSKAEADQVLKDLKAGKKFEELARDRSTDESNKTKGGDLGWATRGAYVPAFENAAFALRKAGQLTGPVQTTFGWHVIQLLQYDASRPMTEEQKQNFGQKKLDDFLKAQREKFRKANQLDVNIPATQTPAPTPVSTPGSAG